MAIDAFTIAAAGAFAVAVAHAVAATGPSRTKARGNAIRKDMTVSTPKRFSGVMFSPLGLSIERRAQMLRTANARFEVIAPPKDSHVNESSVTEASATPKMMGRSERAVSAETEEPRMRYDMPHVNTGSAALTICVKETAPAAAETTAPMWPIAWKKEIGSSVRTASKLSFGGLRIPVSQSGITKAEPTKSEKADCVQGNGSMFNRTLFWML